MNCKKCGLETSTGNTYSFRYGKETGKKSWSSGNKQYTKTTYDVFGFNGAYICDVCLKKRRISQLLLYGIIGVILLGFGGWTAIEGGLWSGYSFLFQILILVVGGLLTVLGIASYFDAEGTGEDYAIALCKKEIQESYSFPLTFFNTAKYNELK